uniref:TctD-like protein n=1 Tax=Pleurostichidium falkenbergii TaxID=121064 RepID=A0A4D6UXM6_9FLOR|nr:hypothetical protein [Pleurostichidium falkenbergii]QCH39745.1 hypothetical protein [Pleurostichidium falkenbergii]
MKKILLVDDDENLCNLLSYYLISFNFSVNSVHSVSNALANLKQNFPDLVISDIMMKDLNGYDFIKILKLDEYFAKIPFIFLTAKGMTVDRIRGYNLGCHGYLTKPFDPKELIAIIYNISNHSQISDRNYLVQSKISFVSSKHVSSFNLTNHERNILRLIIEGYMNKEISVTLDLGQRNVEKYVSRLLSKTNTRNRVELIKLFIKYI